MPKDVFAPCIHVLFFGEPADHHVDILTHGGLIVFLHEHVAAGDIDLVFKGDGDRHGRKRLVDRSVLGVDAFDSRSESAGKHSDVVSWLKNASGDAAGVAAKIMPFGSLWANHPLDGETGIDVIGIGSDVDRLQMVEQLTALIPRHFIGFVNDIVAVEGADRDEGDFRNVEA